MTFFINLLFGLLLTAGIYCIIPLAVASLCKTSIRKKKYLIICIVGEAAIAFAFQYWRTSTGVSGGSFWPAILWGTIFYNAGISILRKRNRLSDSTPPKHTAQSPIESSSPAPQPPTPEAAPPSAPQEVTPVQLTPPPITETWYTCPACGSLVATGKPCDCGYCPHPALPKEPHQPASKKPPRKRVIILSAIAFIAVAATILLCCLGTSSDSSSPETPEELAAYRCCLDIQNVLYFPSTFKLEKDIGYYEFTVGSSKLKYVLIQYSADTQDHRTGSGIDYYRVSDSGEITYLGDDSVYSKGADAPAEMRQFYMLWNHNSPTKSLQIPMGRAVKWLNASIEG